MAEELLRSKHAFGALERVLDAISNEVVDAYDILFLKDKNGKPYIGWVDKNNQPVILQDEKEIITVPTLPSTGETGKLYIYESDGYFWNGTEFVNLCKQTDVSVLEEELKKLKSDNEAIKVDVDMLKTEMSKKADAETINAELDELNSGIADLMSNIEACENAHEKVKYEITDVPIGTLVKHLSNEIRILCPVGTVFTKQSVGNGGDANCYYVTFKTYVPNDAITGYIEHLGDQVDNEILTSFSTDKHGRRYQSTWLALARYDETTDTWTYYGKNSSLNKYIGWDYRIDWYDTDGVMISSDNVRINLSNEDCHYTNEPYYILNANANTDAKIENVTTESKEYTDAQVALILESMSIVEF